MVQSEVQEEQAERIFIPDEEGNEEEFEVIMKFDMDDTEKSYMMVVPVDGNDEEVDEVYAFRYEDNGDDLTLFTIDDDSEWDMVEETFNTLLSEVDDEGKLE